MTAFAARRFVDRSLLVDLSANPGRDAAPPRSSRPGLPPRGPGEPGRPPTPLLGPEQAAARLGVRRVEFDWMVRLGWVRAPQSIEVRFGNQPGRAVDVALYTTASVDAVMPAHPEADWEQLRRGEGPTLSARVAAPGTCARTGVSLRLPSARPRPTPPGRAARGAGVLLASRSRVPGRIPQGSGTPGPVAVEADASPGVLRARMVLAACRKSRVRSVAWASCIGSSWRLPSVTSSANSVRASSPRRTTARGP